ncbi:unnamed protein product [Protopolystoma xenopodis]|uniref:Uncharacterized protein n=1 Tax=Protopolystoma xenopodis TaxID=117903 RepID=A0A3S5BTI6_9PLAT|nr:unnamed protein product [Protopolystoma xenopodis]
MVTGADGLATRPSCENEVTFVAFFMASGRQTRPDRLMKRLDWSPISGRYPVCQQLLRIRRSGHEESVKQSRVWIKKELSGATSLCLSFL